MIQIIKNDEVGIMHILILDISRELCPRGWPDIVYIVDMEGIHFFNTCLKMS